MRQLLWVTGLCALCAFLIVGCSRNSGSSGTTPASSDLKPAAAHASGSMAASTGAGLQYSAPEGWVSEAPTSSMRKAQYRLPRVDGDAEDAEMVVFYFGGGGGGVQANIDRWIGQFTKSDGSPANDIAKISHQTANGIPLTVVDVTGIYMSAMGPMLSEKQSKTNYRMLAAVAETGSGPWFFKLTGPEKTVAKWESSFSSFIEGLHQ